MTTANDYLESIKASVAWLQSHHTYTGIYKKDLKELDLLLGNVIQAIYDGGYEEEEESEQCGPNGGAVK